VQHLIPGNPLLAMFKEVLLAVDDRLSRTAAACVAAAEGLL